MDKTTLGNRMKQYEKAFNHVLPRRIPMMLRLDGVHFSKNVKRWKSDKPFDERLTYAMQQTALGLAKEISGVCLVYSQSDEISILVRDDMTNDTQPWHGKELNKVLSVAAAKATKLFNYYFFSPDFCEKYPKYNEMAEFDCRAYLLPEHEIYSAILWRQQDCTKNSISMLASTLFSTKQLHKKNGNEKQDMMMLEHGVNWNDMPSAFKRGFCVIKRDVEKEIPARDDNNKIIKNEFKTIIRSTWTIDTEIPIFSKDPQYINQFAKIAK